MYEMAYRLYQQAERETIKDLGFCGHPDYHREFATRFVKLIAAQCEDMAEEMALLPTDDFRTAQDGIRELNEALQKLLKS